MITNGNIGETAGKVWCTLAVNNEVPVKKLMDSLNITADQTYMAIGWLARENKVNINTKGNNVYVGLTDNEKKTCDVSRSQCRV